MSKPLVVKVGAVAAAQSTEPGQATVCDPPFVRKRVKPHNSSLAVGLLKVKVLVLVSTVATTLFPKVRLIS